MKIFLSLSSSALTFFMVIIASGCNHPGNQAGENKTPLVKTDSVQLTYILPSPVTDGEFSVERALNQRRSHRFYQDKSISAEQLSQVLWSAYGITFPLNDKPQRRGGLRTAPSAGGLYPFEIYVLIGKVTGIDPGFYRYIPTDNKIVREIDRDLRTELCSASLEQEMIKEAPAVLFYSAIFSRNTDKYGDRGRQRYVCMDLGHSAQNVYLQVETLHLGTCGIAAFNDSSVSQILQLPEEEEPLYIMPVGYYYEKDWYLN